MFELIKALTELTGPVGQEGEVLDYIEPLWQAAGAETERKEIVDAAGHLPHHARAQEEPMAHHLRVRRVLAERRGEELRETAHQDRLGTTHQLTTVRP